MMNKARILCAFDDERRSAVPIRGQIESVGSIRVQHLESEHCVLCSDAAAADLDTVIEDVLDRLHLWGGNLEWKWFAHDANAARLSAALLRHGFTEGDGEHVMVAGTDDLPDTHQAAVIPVTDAGQLSDFQKTACEIFQRNYDFITRQLSDDLRQKPRHHFGFLAHAGTAPVGVGRVFLNAGSRFAYLAGGGVLPEFRRQGYYRSLVLKRVAFARRSGYPYVMSDALPTSKPILQAMGFEPITETRPYTISSARR